MKHFVFVDSNTSEFLAAPHSVILNLTNEILLKLSVAMEIVKDKKLDCGIIFFKDFECFNEDEDTWNVWEIGPSCLKIYANSFTLVSEDKHNSSNSFETAEVYFKDIKRDIAEQKPK